MNRSSLVRTLSLISSFATLFFAAYTADTVYAASLSKTGGIDLDGNGRSALLVRSSDAKLYAGRLVNNRFQFTLQTDPGASFRLVAAADFDGNGKSDLAFQNITQGTFGDVRTWNDFLPANERFWRQVKQVWDVQAVGDLDGDGFGDLIWRYTVSDSPDTGVSYIWFSNNVGVTQVRKRGGAPLTWTLLGAADLNGDGAADMVYVSPDNAVRVLMATANRTCANLSAGSIPAGFTALKLGDFSGKHRGDILIRNAGTGEMRILALDASGLTLPPYTGAPDDQNASCTSSSLTVAVTSYSLMASDPAAQFYASGDFDGNGVSDIVWLQPDNALTVWLLNGVSGTSSLTASAATANAPTVISYAGDMPGTFTALQEGRGSSAATVTQNPPRPQVFFSVATAQAGDTYTAELCFAATQDCESLGGAVFVSRADIQAAGSDIPATIAYAYSVARAYNEILVRLWTAHTPPSRTILLAAFRNAIATALRNDTQTAVQDAISALVAAGFSAAAAGAAGAGDIDGLNYPQVNFAFTCPGIAGTNNIQVSNGPCLSQQKAYAQNVSCNLYDADFTFTSVGRPFYQCVVNNSTGAFKAQYQVELNRFLR